MCCICNGGWEPGECININYNLLDSRSKGCSSYVGSEDECGNYDTEEFLAKTMCCSCGGGFEQGLCFDLDNSGELDSNDNGCDWYEEHKDECGNYDDDDFTALEDCCFCNGGLIYDDVASIFISNNTLYLSET